MQVIFSHSCPSQWVYHVWTMLTVGGKTHIWIKQKKWIWSFLAADIICHSQDQLRKWSWEENISGMSLFGSSWFKLDWEELKIFFFETADYGVFSAVCKAKEVQINKGKHPSGGLFETYLHRDFEMCVVYHWHIHWGKLQLYFPSYKCASPADIFFMPTSSLVL